MNPVQKLTVSVSASASLDPDGETLRVTGSGYDAAKAVHVALCKDNGDNRVPSPCMGGADENGTGSSSQWIVPEGDEYAGDLAVHWGAGGTFDVRIDAKAKDSGLDCTKVACSVVTRVDHRNPGDRSQDVKVPVGFVGQDPVDTDDGTGGTGGTGGSGTSPTGGATGGSGGTDTAAGTGGSGGTGTSTAGGSLASTGVTVLSVAAIAAALPAAGWAAYRRGRTVG
ncbi:hypothetical protein [Streptomyces curacoi]|uniref:Uncharacterized protein n=1 Tax=Streptomyces curacoi TaxID=146536 RepID=A0A124H4I9_9ACTN|nr:hypothetical protein AQI70_12790 [Streptomyces curacoi]